MNPSLHYLCGLIMLGCALALFASSTGATNDPTTAMPALVTPSPAPTPNREPKRPHAVRRFFSWTIDQVSRPFRKEPQLGCVLPPMIYAVTPSKSLITFCPTITSSSLSCSPEREVTVTAEGPDSDGDHQFLFTWEVTGGKIRGEGRTVTWDLTGLPEGTYTAMAEMNDGHQHTANASTSVTIGVCCDRPPPPCPVVSVSCPGDFENQTATFVASVTGGDPEDKLTYKWSVSAGKIVSGQGTSKLLVDATNLGTQPITATVLIDGAHPACTITPASCTTRIY